MKYMYFYSTPKFFIYSFLSAEVNLGGFSGEKKAKS